MDKLTIDAYDKSSKEYDTETVDFWERFPMGIIERFSDEVGVGGKVLDSGAGPGRDGLLLKDRGHDVVCIDASSSMVEACKQRGLDAMKGDFLNLPIENGEMDGVWAYTSLLHIS